jgi:hypothetical protein
MTETVVVFGSQRIAAQWALRNKVRGDAVLLATEPGRLVGRDVGGYVAVVRVPEEYWLPTTHPCEKRVRETEQWLKEFKRKGGKIGEFSGV